MRIDRHVFGSYSGYTTVARSSGVTVEDARMLESGAYAFGQSHDRSYLKTLAKQPAYFTRLVSGGRRALTRVLEGDPDDNNRPTLRLITLIVSQRDWDGLLCGNIESLLEARSLWEWDGSPTLPPVDFTPAAPSGAVPRKSVDKVLALLSATERAVAARRPLLVASDDYSCTELQTLEMLIPPVARRQFTSACRSLSAQLQVNVNLLAAEASSQGRAAFRYSPGAEPSSPYAAFLAATSLTSGTIPFESIAGYQHFGAIEQSVAAMPPALVQRAVRAPPVPRGGSSVWPWLVAAVVALLLSAGTFFVGKSTGSNNTLASEQVKQQAERQQLEIDAAKAVADQAASDRERLKKGLDVKGDTYEELLTASSSKMQDLRNAATTAAHDVAAERDIYRSAYDQELTRQRDRFEVLRREVGAALEIKDIRKAAETSQTLSRIEGELAALGSDWPAGKAEDRKWVDELKSTRERVHAASAIVSSLARVSALLDECEDVIHGTGGFAAENVQANLDEAMDLIGHIPAKGEGWGANIGGERADALARAQKVKGWVNEQQKTARRPPPSGSDPLASATDHLGMEGWWMTLRPEERERIRKGYEERVAADARKPKEKQQK